MLHELPNSKYENQKKKQRHTGVCGKEYALDVLPNLISMGKKLMDDGSGQPWLFMHDGASIHRVGEAVLKSEGIHFITDWGGKMADCNPIENMWGILKSEQRKRGTRSARRRGHSQR